MTHARHSRRSWAPGSPAPAAPRRSAPRAIDGEVVLVGDEPHAPYERPALSKEFLAGKRGLDEIGLFAPSRSGARSRSSCGSARGSSPSTRRTHRHDRRRRRAPLGRARPRDRRARRGGFRSPAPPGVHVLRTASDALALRDELVPGTHLVIVGGGFVGAEVASTAIELGVTVTMIVGGLAPFARTLGPEIGRLLAHRYRLHGVDVRLGVGAAGFRTRPDGLTTVIALGRTRSRLRHRARRDRLRPRSRADAVRARASDLRLRRRRRQRRPLDSGCVRRDRRRSKDPRPRAPAGAAALLLVGPVRPPPPARRRPGRGRPRRARGRAGRIRGAVPRRRR